MEKLAIFRIFIPFMFQKYGMVSHNSLRKIKLFKRRKCPKRR